MKAVMRTRKKKSRVVETPPTRVSRAKIQQAREVVAVAHARTYKRGVPFDFRKSKMAAIKELSACGFESIAEKLLASVDSEEDLERRLTIAFDVYGLIERWRTNRDLIRGVVRLVAYMAHRPAECQVDGLSVVTAARAVEVFLTGFTPIAEKWKSDEDAFDDDMAIRRRNPRASWLRFVNRQSMEVKDQVVAYMMKAGFSEAVVSHWTGYSVAALRMRRRRRQTGKQKTIRKR